MMHDAWVMPYFARYRRVLALALGLGALASAAACALMGLSGWLIGAAARRPDSILVLMLPIGVVQLLGLGKPAATYAERLVGHDWVLRMTSDLRRRLFLALERLVAAEDAGAEARVGFGEAQALLAEDVAHVQDLYVRSVFPLTVSWVVAGVSAACLGFLDAPAALWLALALFVLVAVVPAVSFAYGAAMRVRRRAHRDRWYAQVSDAVLGAADLAFAGRAGEYAAASARLAAAADKLDARLARHARIRDAAVRTVMAGVTAALACRVAVDGMDADVAMAVVLCCLPLSEAVAAAGDAAGRIPSHLETIRRLNGLDVAGKGAPARAFAGGKDAVRGAARPAVPAPPRAAAVSVCAHGARGVGMVPPSAVPVACDEGRDITNICASTRPGIAVVFDDVTFSYPAERDPVLRDLSFEVPVGSKMALLGRSGVGKSTMLALLRGDLAPQVGRVTCYGDVGVIEQDPHVFNSTVLDNLRLADPRVSEMRAREVLERVGLWDRVSRFEGGLLGVVGEGGYLLSGGERHRLALARILLVDTPVVLLDEPFAALDPATEAQVMDTLLSVLVGRTVIMVTHHVQGLERWDRVVVLENGCFAIDGAPADLARDNPFYKELSMFG